MRTSYAVTWQEPSCGSQSGKLELGGQGMIFEGSSGNGPVRTEVGYEEISTIQVARAPGDRLAGRPTLLLERGGNAPIRIASVAQTGIVTELAEHLAKVLLEQRPKMSRLAVVVPLQDGARDRAQSLIRAGPPFDLQESGLESHYVFVTDSEVVFLFAGESRAAIERLAGEAHLWTVASTWKDLLAGPPRIAEDAYAWVQPKGLDGTTFASTPGPGDSEGGDLFEP
jgi:hypothetical protein